MIWDILASDLASLIGALVYAWLAGRRPRDWRFYAISLGLLSNAFPQWPDVLNGAFHLAGDVAVVWLVFDQVRVYRSKRSKASLTRENI